MSKRLIINADDYGISSEVNGAIEDLIVTGRLTDVSVLANGWAYDQASSFLKAHSRSSAGVHLNVVEGIALSPRKRVAILIGRHGEFVDLQQLMFRWTLSPFAVAKAVETEWREQIEVLLKDGLTITHADSHQHVHAFPPFWRILIRLCSEYKIPAMRFPRERNHIGRRRAGAFMLGLSTKVARLVSSSSEPISNDHFLGFKRAGEYGESEMISDLKELKDGLTELIIHPSLYNGVPYSKMRGEAEYDALRGERVLKQIEQSGLILTSWGDATSANA